MARLRTDVVAGHDLSTDELRRLYDLAGHLAQVRPGREDQHWQDYEAFARDGEVVRFTCDGEVRGFFMRRHDHGHQGGRPFRWTQDEYYFIDPAWRGHAGPELARVRQFARIVGRGGPPCWFVGECYPASYLVARDAFGHLDTGADPLTDPWVRDVLVQLGTRIAGDRFDPETGLIRTDTIPPPAPARFARPAHEAGFRAYEAVNPDWRDGWTVLFVARIDARAIARLVGASAERVTVPVRRLARRRPA